MSEQTAVVVEGYHSSNRNEYKLTTDVNHITLAFPSILQTGLSAIRQKCLRIDHIVLEYRSQVPMNAQGTVIVEIHDKRLLEGETKQAEFTIPIKCNCNIHYYSSSFFSPKDTNPWVATYRVEDTNIHMGVRFCTFKGKLKLSEAQESSDIIFRQPKIEIKSKGFTPRDIDFWSVGEPQKVRRLITGAPVGRSQSSRFQPITILPGESWATKSDIGGPAHLQGSSSIGPTTDRPYRELHTLQPNFMDPGPSVSEVGSNRRHTLSEADIDDIVSRAVKQCLVQNNKAVGPKPI
ncbi:movement protein [Ocimum mosaic virus]|uniref:Movement protein BC1 n=1 Tax=Ocimum mosaic virus TaxID=2664941 RepID=A0A5Q0TS39_9GEMI|nr:movement protein [Ocimum mosaic virus]QGA69864.1 movement protein [Ocimum mosaic virus]